MNAEFEIRKWDHYSVIRKVGQIPLTDIQAYKSPNRYARLIEYNLIPKVHDQMCVLNQSNKWSSTLNCQRFTRCCCVQYFKFKFPEDINIISDVMPSMINSYNNESS